MIITILAFVIVFGILVFVHEFGHFIVAKRSGIMVREFSIGMGPKIFFYRHNQTTYTIRILPLGGYVRMAGIADNDSQELDPGTPVTLKFNEQNEVILINTSQKQKTLDGLPLEVSNVDLEHELFIEGYQDNNEEVKRFKVNHDALMVEHDGTKVQIAPEDVQFQNAPVFKKLLTNAAGIVNNVILAIVAFTILTFMQGGVASNQNTVTPIQGHSVARDAGIKNGDRIVQVDNQKTDNWNELSSAIQARPDQKVTLVVKRYGQVKIIKLTTESQKNNGKKYGLIGIGNTVDSSFTTKLFSGFTRTWNMTKQLVSELAYMVSGHFSLNDLGGPVAIYASTSQATKLGLQGVVYFIAFLSINLAIMNLIPIPVLDGGKILMNIIEAVRRKPTSEKVETIVTLIGFAFLVVLMLLVTINDIQRYFIH
ncbi:Regulator of sigma-W protease RasP [Apilactobacillus kunkeei]|uniref:Zinc metalloprotease n=1 Tax=Apilactobacillus kunkeei TaxID=148814 RepID=A0AAC8ZYU8_9LACO|nr:RIP metalloprotease RseP [Apilactobacillus kunkeei]ALJ31757.1 metalloprotease RseP [Apilactobacillus kunkeei]KFJ15045.1 metalloprotease RseP [Apilactobacillus kunkeei]UZX32681.1 RIP metalloprotease RseP [Apilactobacillus kunkeei]CAI2610728.1 Regulator of sigma-W protease RasP [Apilactobacillus kunkeei]CAI2611091.1 Regulator of sigma-W protease RasP [Apilactobacillus kunkeei]